MLKLITPKSRLNLAPQSAVGVTLVQTLLFFSIGCSGIYKPTHIATAAQLGSIYNHIIDDNQLSNRILQFNQFKHRVLGNAAFNELTPMVLSASLSERKTLHVYIEGDGVVRQQGAQINKDPTPLKPIALNLMLLDEQPSVYLGRPCYFVTDDKQCNPIYWTTARYHQSVVQSLLEVIRYYKRQGFNEIWLFGFSGGGTLATLMAQNQSMTTNRSPSDFTDHHDRLIAGVITLAANLDIANWAQLNNAQDLLQHSMNPTTHAVQDARREGEVLYFHFEGTLDNNVTNASTAAFKNRFDHHWFSIDTDHSCCWQAYWSDILKLIE